MWEPSRQLLPIPLPFIAEDTEVQRGRVTCQGHTASKWESWHANSGLKNCQSWDSPTAPPKGPTLHKVQRLDSAPFRWSNRALSAPLCVSLLTGSCIRKDLEQCTGALNLWVGSFPRHSSHHPGFSQRKALFEEPGACDGWGEIRLLTNARGCCRGLLHSGRKMCHFLPAPISFLCVGGGEGIRALKEFRMGPGGVRGKASRSGRVGFNWLWLHPF